MDRVELESAVRALEDEKNAMALAGLPSENADDFDCKAGKVAFTLNSQG